MEDNNGFDMEDQLIVFLDAASDSNYDTLKQTYEKVTLDDQKVELLTFADSDGNTALHFGAKNGNVNICRLIIDEAIQYDCIRSIVNKTN